MKTKILHVVLSLETGGLENGIVNLVNKADPEKYIVDVLCLRELGTLAARIINPESKVIFDGNRDHGIRTAIAKIMTTCKKGQYQIIHSHGFTTMLTSYFAGKIMRVPLIINGEHGVLYDETIKQRWLQKFLFSRMNHNLTVSTDLKYDIKKRFNIKKDNFTPIINGVDTVKFSVNKGIGCSIKQQLNLSDDFLLIGSVGRLVEVKNYKSLIDAFSVTVKKHPSIHLVLAGDGTEKEALNKQVTDLNLQGHVHLLGNRDDIPNIMNALDIFVLPSFSEGLSNTLLEAMSCGTPVIASNVGGNSEIVIPDHSGYLYESDNIQQLSELLNRLVSAPDLIKKLSVQARQHILDNYSLQSMVDNYESEYNRLLIQYGILPSSDKFQVI
jgi:sugar transferase (PEP-CTERM/EpsH1 system associated)